MSLSASWLDRAITFMLAHARWFQTHKQVQQLANLMKSKEYFRNRNKQKTQ